MKKQSKIEKRNRFRCVVCESVRVRGCLVSVKIGEHKGVVVKCCQSKKCVELASVGNFFQGGEK